MNKTVVSILSLGLKEPYMFPYMSFCHICEKNTAWLPHWPKEEHDSATAAGPLSQDCARWADPQPTHTYMS